MASPASTSARLTLQAVRLGWQVTTIPNVDGTLYSRGEVTIYVRFDTHGRLLAARIGEGWLTGRGKAAEVAFALAEGG